MFHKKQNFPRGFSIRHVDYYFSIRQVDYYFYTKYDPKNLKGSIKLAVCGRVMKSKTSPSDKWLAWIPDIHEYCDFHFVFYAYDLVSD